MSYQPYYPPPNAQPPQQQQQQQQQGTAAIMQQKFYDNNNGNPYPQQQHQENPPPPFYHQNHNNSNPSRVNNNLPPPLPPPSPLLGGGGESRRPTNTAASLPKRITAVAGAATSEEDDDDDDDDDGAEEEGMGKEVDAGFDDDGDEDDDDDEEEEEEELVAVAAAKEKQQKTKKTQRVRRSVHSPTHYRPPKPYTQFPARSKVLKAEAFVEEGRAIVEEAKIALCKAQSALKEARKDLSTRIASRQEITLANLDEILQVEHRRKWCRGYQRLLKYYQQHGHSITNVDTRVDGKSPALAALDAGTVTKSELSFLTMWTGHQRQDRKRGRIQYWRVLALDRCDFIWDLEDHYWMELYKELVAYKQQHGTANVKASNERGGTSHRLYRWYKKQQDAYTIWKNAGFPENDEDEDEDPSTKATTTSNDGSKMTRKKCQLLEALGMTWRRDDTAMDAWETMFTKAQKWYQTWGNLNVPWVNLSKTQQQQQQPRLLTHNNNSIARQSEKQNQLELYDWLEEQRELYATYAANNFRSPNDRRHLEKMNKTKRQRLEAIGMIWMDPHEGEWNSNYKQLLSFQKNKGHTHCPALREWLQEQRLAYQQYKSNGFVEPTNESTAEEELKKMMNNERKEKLESIDFIWDEEEAKWDNYYTQLKELYHKNGHVRTGIVQLNQWIQEQRIAYQNQNSLQQQQQPSNTTNTGAATATATATATAATATEAGNNDPSASNHNNNNNNDDNNTAAATNTTTTTTNTTLLLTPERIEKLQSIKFYWTAEEETWDKNYRLLKSHHTVHGNITSMKGRRDIDTWLEQQREEYRKFRESGFADPAPLVTIVDPSTTTTGTTTTKQPLYRMNQQRVLLLDEIGMDWRSAEEIHWETMFGCLKTLREQQGHLYISETKTVFHDFVNQQQQLYKLWIDRDDRKDNPNNKMTLERICKLESIDFPWTPNEMNWLHYYAGLQAIWEEQHHLFYIYCWTREHYHLIPFAKQQQTAYQTYLQNNNNSNNNEENAGGGGMTSRRLRLLKAIQFPLLDDNDSNEGGGGGGVGWDGTTIPPPSMEGVENASLIFLVQPPKQQQQRQSAVNTRRAAAAAAALQVKSPHLGITRRRKPRRQSSSTTTTKVKKKLSVAAMAEQDSNDNDQETQPANHQGGIVRKKKKSTVMKAPRGGIKRKLPKGKKAEEGAGVLDDDDEDETLQIGTTFQKKFGHHGYFTGTIMTSPYANHRYYRVKYDDGDQEDLSKEELMRLLRDKKMRSAAEDDDDDEEEEAERPTKRRRGRPSSKKKIAEEGGSTNSLAEIGGLKRKRGRQRIPFDL